MKNIDEQYLDLLGDILKNGYEKGDRTGTGTISVFGRQIRHKMSDGFPALTTKKLAWKQVYTELQWFLKGETNIQPLVKNGNNIWVGDAYKSYLTKMEELEADGNHDEMNRWMSQWEDNTFSLLTRKKFIELIKTDDEFAEKWGELGPIYGKQWREWKTQVAIPTTLKVDDGDDSEPLFVRGTRYIDQIQNLINDLKTNPDSRRLMVNAWNVGELNQMVLPPCHYGFQVYTRKLTDKERYDIWFNNNYETGMERYFDSNNLPDFDNDYYEPTPTRAISLMYNARSQDVPLGTPFNIASYALFLVIISKMVNMVPDELIANMGDCHIYKNQIEAIKEQLTREPYKLPNLKINDTLNFNGDIDEFLNSWDSDDDFILEDYNYHPTIKIPLSN